jgi:hypothetical protein
MEEIGFLVESSEGDLDVRLTADGWCALEFKDPGDDPVIVENVVRTAEELASSFETIGLPADEAAELAEELWDELDVNERAERARIKPF